jgi:hypothetical protein
MPSITSWNRLEPRARRADMRPSLEARIHDPAWMLGRQWQLGEFAATDGGSLAVARWEAELSELVRYKPGPWRPGSTGAPYDGTIPLETWVERERVQPLGDYRQAVEAGLQLLRVLGDAFVARHGPGLRAVFRLEPSEDERSALDDESLRFIDLVAGRALNGVALRARLPLGRKPREAPALPAAPPFDAIVAAGDGSQLVQALTTWLDWYDELYGLLAQHGAWSPLRMEYEFAVAAPLNPAAWPGDGPAGELVLVAPEYHGGHLDWYSFDVAPRGSALGAADQTPATKTQVALPAPLSLRGMPAPRWWEFEDGQINLAAVDTAPEDLSRMLFLEYALVFSNDYFFIPVDVLVGSVCRTTALAVYTVFGEEVLIPAADSSLRMFQLAADRRDERASGPPPPTVLFLPPALGQSIESPPFEEVLLLRDEMANMAWAVERLVSGQAGLTVRRAEQLSQERRRAEQRTDEKGPGATAPSAGPLVYRLVHEAPLNWIPLIPRHTDNASRAIGLWVGAGSHGWIMGEATGDMINEEEVPRAGAAITRSYQLARWVDGSTHLWVGRRKRTGRGEGSSGLRFDAVAPQPSES